MAEVDFAALFDAAPTALALLSPDLVFVTVNRAYERLLGRSREEIVGRDAFEVFPGGSSPERADTLRSSLQRAFSEDTTDTVMLQRYDVEIPGSPGTFQERYWSVTNAPLLSSEGTVCGVIVRLQEVTPPSSNRFSSASRRPTSTSLRVFRRWRPNCSPRPMTCRRSTSGCTAPRRRSG